jgi:hypothetical protein
MMAVLPVHAERALDGRGSVQWLRIRPGDTDGANGERAPT